MAETPMIRQYLDIKEKNRDSILCFRLGDFYEMFFDDAKVASRVLDLTLTSRNKNQENAIPLCGFPAVAAQGYIHRLLQNGHRVAICEQVSDPKLAKGIVERQVTQVFTPALVMDPECLEQKANSWLVSVCAEGEHFGLAWADITTGQFSLVQVSDSQKLEEELARVEPREILIPRGQENADWFKPIRQTYPKATLQVLDGWHFDPEFGRDLYKKFYKTDLESLGLTFHPQATRAGGALLSYLNETQFLKDAILSRPVLQETKKYLVLDESTKRNLELLRTAPDGDPKGSLFWHIDCAQTPMGSRTLRQWLLHPLCEATLIENRLDAVEFFVNESRLLTQVRELLQQFSDIERIQNRVVAGLAHARDLCALAQSLETVPALLEILSVQLPLDLKETYEGLHALPQLKEKILTTLVPEPPLGLRDGGLIQNGISPELDELRDIEKNGKSFISAMETGEREKTGISSLKIRYNSVFGYYIEVTHAHRDKVPAHYIRKQTLTQAERYITPELKQYEDKVLSASEKIRALEYDVFLALRTEAASYHPALKKLAQSLSRLDAFAALAHLAIESNYRRPKIVEEPILDIQAGRHPLVERHLSGESFVPNDICICPPKQTVMLITGPNMAGKSTVMRQAALIVLMAHLGSFVPATEATIGVCDRIFTRIGASDYLQKGQSTFMVEMLETAQILNRATEKSLIILDEIGRGTSTFDGLSIAWAVCETLHDQVRARALFATHYHELTDLTEQRPGIENYHMTVREWNGEIRFLRELKKGATNRSYGITVAQMAGLPPQAISRAREVLRLLEEKDLAFASEVGETHAKPLQQASLFEDLRAKVWQKLETVDLNTLTPLEALNFLAKIKKEMN